MIAEATPVDPRKLTPALKTALMNVHDFGPSRTRGGYGRFPESFISLKTAQKLIHMRLARVDHSARGPRLLITKSGFNTWSALMERQDTRKRA